MADSKKLNKGGPVRPQVSKEKTPEPAPPMPAKRYGSTRTLAAILPKVTAQSLGKQGFAAASVITDWALIVGKELADVTLPQRIAFPVGKRSHGTLHLRVAGAMALDVQHRSPQILARINGYFGYAAVTHLKLSQGAIARPAETSRPEGSQVPAKGAEAPPEAAAPDVAAALERLGAAIAADSARRRRT